MKQNTKNLSTGIYVRVSTDEQVQEGFSVRAQTEKLKTYALLKDWEIFDLYADEGISGKNIVDRPAINRLIEDIQNGKVNNVLVFKVDRLTRSTKDLIELVDLFEDCNCAFNSLTESIDTDTPSGRMFLKIIGIFAEFERENLVTRLKLGFERKVKEGYTLANSTLSYGYIKPKGQKIQTIEPDEAKIVKEIFSMYLDENMSMNGIAQTLNVRGIPTKMNAPMWDMTTIKRLLTNPNYIGKVRYSTAEQDKYMEVDGNHEPIISQEMFYLTQEKINNSGRIYNTKRPKEDNYFCGVLHCGLCGKKFTTHNQAPKIDENGVKIYKTSYWCMGKKAHNPNPCKCPEISHEKMERAFIEYIEKIGNFTETEDMKLDNDSAKNREKEQFQNIIDLENRINAIDNKKKQVTEQYLNDKIPFEEYRNLLDNLKRKNELFDNELSIAKSSIQPEQEKSSILPEDIILELKENWEYLNNKERMMFLHEFINKIVIRVEKEHARSNFVRIEDVEFNTFQQTKS